MNGFFYPRTATGQAALIPPPPWHYNGDLLTVEYRTDPERVRELLPALELAPEDGRGRLHLGRLAVLPGLEGEHRPSSSTYKEAFVVVRCAFRKAIRVFALRLHLGRPGLRDPTRDAPGLPEEARVDPPDPTAPYGPAPRVAVGATFGATVAAADRRLAEAVLTLTRESRPTASSTPPHGPPPGLPLDRARRPDRRLLRADLLRIGVVRGRAGLRRAVGAALRPPRKRSPGSRSKSSAATYRQVGVAWDGGSTWRSSSPDVRALVDGDGRPGTRRLGRLTTGRPSLGAPQVGRYGCSRARPPHPRGDRARRCAAYLSPVVGRRLDVCRVVDLPRGERGSRHHDARRATPPRPHLDRLPRPVGSSGSGSRARATRWPLRSASPKRH